jgi:GntP family gluconate:H+ symporter
MQLNPILILLAGFAAVLVPILVLRLNAFFSLIGAALLVSFLAPGPTAEKVTRVAAAFGATVGNIGIVIALAAVVGVCMLESRAADRIVDAFLKLFGKRRADTALLGSGFVLSIPVFFDTVFYLLIPLARAMFHRTGKHYAKYVMVIAAGAILTHSLVPPTPGPLASAQNLGVDIGSVLIVGLMVAIPAAAVGFVVAGWIDRRANITGPAPASTLDEKRADTPPPNLLLSLLPIILPVVLISTDRLVAVLIPGSEFANVLTLLGNPNTAMLAAATAAMLLYVAQVRPNRAQLNGRVEGALMSAGLIILITSAGGAFGAMLQVAQIGPAITASIGDSANQGTTLLFIGFAMASVLKLAQGSSTIAMITSSAMLGAMTDASTLPFNGAYLATAIGCGSIVGSWMNDSGFWIVSRLGGLSEMETLKTWSTIAATVGVTAFLCTLALAQLIPLK